MKTTAEAVNLQAIIDQGTPLRQSDPLYQSAAEFLATEAHVLDRRQFNEWLTMLAPEIHYRVPVRVTSASSSSSDELLPMEHFFENYRSLEARVRRLDTEHAWAEDPPSRTRRFVTNLRTFAYDDDHVVTESYLLLYRSRGDQLNTAILSGVRMDLLRILPDEKHRLVKRLVVLDDSVLNTQNLALFL